MRKVTRSVAGMLAILLFSSYVFIALWLQVNLNAGLPSDLEIYVRAGGAALRGESAYYPFAVGQSYVYPPSALLLFSPLSLLPIEIAELLWATLCVLTYLGAFAALWISLRPSVSPTWLIWSVGGYLMYSPFLETLAIGQVNCLVLLGLALFTLGTVENKYRWVGDIGLAVAIMAKMTPVMLLAIPVLHRDWRRVLRVLGGMSALGVVSLLYLGLTPWVEFVQVFPQLFQGYYYLSVLSSGMATEQVITWIGRVSSAAILGVWGGVLLWWAVSSKRQGDFKENASIGCRHDRSAVFLIAWSITTMTISSSLLWYHHLVFLVIPLAVLLLDVQDRWLSRFSMLGWIALTLVQIARLAEYRGLASYFLFSGCLLLFVTGGIRVVNECRARERV